MKVWVTGYGGLIGSNLVQFLKNAGINCLGTNKTECNLIIDGDINNFIKKNKPDIVIHCAAKAGGIGANINNNHAYFYENILINTNLLKVCADNNIKKVINMSSVAVFPTVNKVLNENDTMLDDPYIGDFGYGWAKRMMEIQSQCIKLQYDLCYTQLLLTNTFGPYDNFNLQYGHCIPTLIHKAYLSKKNNEPMVVWGNGSSIREFIYVKDICKIIHRLLYINDLPNKIILSTQEKITIKHLVNIIFQISELTNDIIFDESKPNGQTHRHTSNELLLKLIPDLDFQNIEQSIRETWNWFCVNYPNVRK